MKKFKRLLQLIRNLGLLPQIRKRVDALPDMASALRAVEALQQSTVEQLAAVALALEEAKEPLHPAREVARDMPFFEPGHYYSPIADKQEVARRWEAHTAVRPILGINLNHEHQEAVLEDVLDAASVYSLPEQRDSAWRYYADNWMFGRTDATILAGMLRHYRPRRVVEVGSGFSSAVMLDVCERDLPHTRLTFAEPFADRLRTLLRPTDSATLLELPVQDLPMSVFEELDADDFLFIDSTHVTKTASDVNFEFFEVFPRLKPGVIIHLHDIFYPFEYPKLWAVEENRGWNELYLLRAFLSANDAYEVLLWPHMLMTTGNTRMASTFKTGGGSFWMRVKG